MVLEAQYVGLRTLANGSVRLTFDVPVERLADVVSLFQKEGDPAAIARLREDHDADLPDVEDVRGILAPPKRKWEDLTPAQQAGIRCEDPMFAEFVAEQARGDEDPATWVRRTCRVMSRAHLNDSLERAERWNQIEGDYQSWLTTQKYAEARR